MQLLFKEVEAKRQHGYAFPSTEKQKESPKISQG
jgi:hypothetical protein